MDALAYRPSTSPSTEAPIISATKKSAADTFQVDASLGIEGATLPSLRSSPGTVNVWLMYVYEGSALLRGEHLQRVSHFQSPEGLAEAFVAA